MNCQKTCQCHPVWRTRPTERQQNPSGWLSDRVHCRHYQRSRDLTASSPWRILRQETRRSSRFWLNKTEGGSQQEELVINSFAVVVIGITAEKDLFRSRLCLNKLKEEPQEISLVLSEQADELWLRLLTSLLQTFSSMRPLRQKWIISQLENILLELNISQYRLGKLRHNTKGWSN